MDAGRELDALIAEKVFGYDLDYEFADTLGAPTVNALRDQYDEWGILPNYSTDIGDAWLVVDALSKRGIWLHSLEQKWEESTRVSFEWRDSSRGLLFAQEMGSTAPHAICLAALNAIGGEE